MAGARNYLLILLLSALTVAGVPTAANLVTDPYGLWRSSPSAPPRPNAIIRDERTAKILRARSVRAEVILLGTSRTAVGIPTEPDQWDGKSVYNLAFGGQALRESRLLMEQVVPATGARTVFLGLDFFASNVWFAGSPALTEHMVAGTPAGLHAESLVSWQTFEHSLALLRAGPDYVDLTGSYDSTSGALRWSDAYVRAHSGHRSMFVESETSYLNEIYLPPPRRAFALVDPVRKRSAEEELRRILRAAHTTGIDLRLAISPSHARQWTLLAQLGLWGQFEDWKRMLVRVTEDEAAWAHLPAFPLWDFADYSPLTTEAIPPRDGVMRRYWDSSHFRPDLGTLVLRRMKGQSDIEGTSEAFGTRITAANVEAHLLRVRVARERYEREAAEDVAELAKLVRDRKRNANVATHPLPKAPS